MRTLLELLLDQESLTVATSSCTNDVHTSCDHDVANNLFCICDLLFMVKRVCSAVLFMPSKRLYELCHQNVCMSYLSLHFIEM